MDLERFFLDHRLPRQFVHAGSGYIDLYRIENKVMKKIHSSTDITLPEITSTQFETLCAPLSASSTGLVLNSGVFIYNIFEFQRLPLLKRRRIDLIRWRVQKVFPEKLEQYDHQFFALDRQRIFSILLRRELRNRMDELFRQSGRPLTFLGNSTVEIMNHLLRGRSMPDLFVEIDNGLITVCFQKKTVPFYIRKFRVGKENELEEEIAKTLDYVSKNNGYSPLTFSLIPLQGKGFVERIEAEFARRGLKNIPVASPAELIIPRW